MEGGGGKMPPFPPCSAGPDLGICHQPRSHTKVVFTVTNGFEQDTQMHTLLLRAKGGGNTLNLGGPAKNSKSMIGH